MQTQKKRYRIVNTTNIDGRGSFLDLGSEHQGIILPAGKSTSLELAYIPQLLMDWAEQGKIKIYDAETGEAAAGTSAVDISRGAVAPVGEVSASEFDIGEDEPDLNEAIPAALPSRANGAHMPDNAQQSRAKVTLGHENEEYPSDEISPIPGDRPRSIDDSAKFTVKAPRAQGVGGILGR